jgi:hypothetical protein
MNKTQREILYITCFVLGVALIFGAGAEYTGYSAPLDLFSWDLFASLKFYLGLVSIGAGFFFLKGNKK